MLFDCTWKCSNVKWLTCLNGMRHACRLYVEVFKVKWFTCLNGMRHAGRLCVEVFKG
jgi:hypothetical protein